MNALKSGLHAESHVIRGEDPQALAQLTAEYYDEFHPTTPRQRDLVDTIVHNQWLIRRLRLTEADLYSHHFANRDHDFDPKWHFQHLQREHALADSFACMEKQLARLQSRLNALERSTRAAVKELRECQRETAVPACPPAKALPESHPEESTTSPEIGFVPSIPQAPPPEQPDRPTFCYGDEHA